MITFDFDYYRPESIAEALTVYREQTNQGKNVIYYSGGTEVIYLARRNELCFDAAIDLKEIPECNQLGFGGDQLCIGAAVTLSKIVDSGLYPLLSSVGRQIADHTARNQITLGGNICGRIPYKEALLPLLLAKAEVQLAGPEGPRSIGLTHVFKTGWQFRPGEFVVQVTIEKRYTSLQGANLKKTKQANTGYPLLTVAALKEDMDVTIALSGLCSFPFQTAKLKLATEDQAVAHVMSNLPGPVVSDQLGSANYREFVLTNAVAEIMESLGGRNDAGG